MRAVYLDECSKAVARAVDIDPYFVRWQRAEPIGDDALVIHTPWARVVVARSVGGAERFVSEYRQGECLWLLDALEEAYPIEASPTLPPERLVEVPLADKALQGFRKWAIGAGDRFAWPATPFTKVIGSWTTYRDGLLLRHANGRCILRHRSLLPMPVGGFNGRPDHFLPSKRNPAEVDQLDRSPARDSRALVPPTP